MGSFLDDFKPVPVARFGGMVDYQGVTRVINGCAVKAQNCDFSFDDAGTRPGTQTTIADPQDQDSPNPYDVTGLDCLVVGGQKNPGEIPIVFGDDGGLRQESPSGSGTLIDVAAPLPFPAGARMQTTQGENSLFMGFDDGENGLFPPHELYGPTGQVITVSKNAPGMPWTPGVIAQIGDLVAAADGRWWRCTSPGIMGTTEPAWPADGYFIGGQPVDVVNQVSASASQITFKKNQQGDTTPWHPPSGQVWYVVITRVVAGQEVAIGPVFGPFSISLTTEEKTGGHGDFQWDLVLNDYTSLQVFIPADTLASAYKVYLGQGSSALSQFTLVNSIPSTAALQKVQLFDYRVFTSTTGPNVVAPTVTANNAQWVPSVASDPNGPSQWEEWTPAVTTKLPVAQYMSVQRTMIGTTVNILGLSRKNGVVSCQTNPPWRFVPGIAIGDSITAATGDGGWDGTYVITGLNDIVLFNGNVLVPASITWAQAGADAIGPTSGTLTDNTLLTNAVGSIGAGLDVYVRFAFTSLTEGDWYPPVLYANTQASDSITMIFQNLGDSTYAGPGGPRIPNWLSQLIKLPGVFFGVNMNVYAASVTHGAGVPTTYGLVGTFGIGQRVVIASIPSPTIPQPASLRDGQIALKAGYISLPSQLPNFFRGETGIRYVAIMRKNIASSLSAITPSAVFPMQCTNGAAQPVFFVPPPGSDTLQTVAALTVAGGSQAGPFNYIPTADPPNIFSAVLIAPLSRSGNTVSAVMDDISGFTPGQIVGVTDNNPADYAAGGVTSFVGEFTLATVNYASNTITWPQTGANATTSLYGNIVISVQQTLPTVAEVTEPAVAFNFDDGFLAASTDVTIQLTALPAPNASDLSFIPSLRQMAYVDNNTYPGAFVFSVTDDPGNIIGDSGDPNNPGSGILIVEDGSISRAIAVRELEDQAIIALKEDGGYRINVGNLLPSDWSPVRQWKEVGPASAELVAVGKSPDGKGFIAFWDRQKGPHIFAEGGINWIGLEIQQTLKRVNTNALNNGWAVVDEDRRELKFGIALDSSLVPNYEFCCNYLTGWGPQEVLNRYGKLITTRDARRWSINPLFARTAKVVKRTLGVPTNPYVQTPPVTPSIQKRQFLYGLRGDKFLSNNAVPLYSASRLGGVVTFTIKAPNTITPLTPSSVVVTGFNDSSFNGPVVSFISSSVTPTGDTILQFEQDGLDATTYGGFIAPAILGSKITMITPDKYDDDGVGIDFQYQPWYTQQDVAVLKFGGYRGQLTGNGQITFQPVTDDPNDQFPAGGVLLDGSGIAQHFERGLRMEGEHGSIVISNGAQPGAWCRIQEFIMYAIPKFAGRRS